MPAARSQQPDPGSRLPNAGSQPPDATLDARCRKPAAQSWFPATGCWLPDTGHQTPAAGCPLKKATLSFQQSGFFIPCRGREFLSRLMARTIALRTIAAECCLCCFLTQLTPCFCVHPWAVISPCPLGRNLINL